MKYRVRIDLQGIDEDDYDNLLDEIDTVRRKYGVDVVVGLGEEDDDWEEDND